MKGSSLLPLLFTLAFAAAYLHARVPSRRPPAGWLARTVLVGGACLFALYGFYELSIQRETKAENVPIRIDLMFIRPALVCLMVLGIIAYFCSLAAPGPGPRRVPPAQPSPGLAPGDPTTVTREQANERLARLLRKPKDPPDRG
jgi:hypothetical protein